MGAPMRTMRLNGSYVSEARGAIRARNTVGVSQGARAIKEPLRKLDSYRRATIANRQVSRAGFDCGMLNEVENGYRMAANSIPSEPRGSRQLAEDSSLKIDLYFERVPYRRGVDRFIDVQRKPGTLDVIVWCWRLIASRVVE